MKKDFRWLASELARQTMDSGADSTLDLTVAQASHALKTLREIARFAPDEVAEILGLGHTMPPLGICLPCEWISCSNGNRVLVRLPAGQCVTVELLGCRVVEQPPQKATHFLESLFEQDGALRVCLPVTWQWESMQAPVPGYIYIGTENVSDIMVRCGFATKEKLNG